MTSTVCSLIEKLISFLLSFSLFLDFLVSEFCLEQLFIVDFVVFGFQLHLCGVSEVRNNSFGLNGAGIHCVRFLVVVMVFLLGLKVTVVDTADYIAVNSISFSIIFMHKTVIWVERSLKFTFFKSFLQSSLRSCCFSSLSRSF